MLERTLKVIKVSQPQEIFNRHYQLTDFDVKSEFAETGQQSPNHRSRDANFAKSRSKSRSKSRDRKKEKNKKQREDPYSNYREVGFSKAEIAELRKLEEELKCEQYGIKSKIPKKDLKVMKSKVKKAQDLVNLSLQQEADQNQFVFRKQMFSDDDSEEKVPSKHKNNKKEPKPQEFYPPFLSQEIVIESRKREENRYFVGQLFLNNPYAGRIITEEVTGEIQVRRQNINRAMHESVVYFQFVKKQPSSDEEPSDVQNLKDVKHSRIVCVKQNPLATKPLVGKIQRFGEQYIFQPINTKIRKMNVGKGSPNHKTWKQQYYTAKFLSWEHTQKFPVCELLQKFGTIGDIETQCRVLLQLNEVYEGDFGSEITQFLKKFTDKTSAQGQYIIPEEEYKKRHDLRNDLIFTIDPLTARDFDDALSIKQIGPEEKKKHGVQTQKSVYEVGIHIADVAYFVEQNSPLDLEAQKRTTSVYLIHRVLPMLPRVLCQTMCSLNPGVERLAVSVWCYIDEEGNVLQKTRFGRSVIKSKARYTYETAQDVITQKIKLPKQGEKQEKRQSFGAGNVEDEPQLFQAIKLMNTLAVLMKSKRQSNGSLSIQNHKKQFKLDDNCEPISYSISQRFESNFLVEEFMLLANIEVAQFVVRNLGDVSLLRRHMFPSEKKINRFKQFMKRFGLEFDIDKQTKLSEYVSEILDNPGMKASTKQLIQHQLVFLLEAAEYFIVGDSEQSSWEHYALGYKQYTHFTSPIRRYPDIIVHRQLLKIIESNNLKQTIEQKIASKALIERCNKCKIAARKVSSGCEKIFMCLYLKKNPVTCRGIISQIGASTIIVCIPEYDIRTPIVLKQIKCIKEKQFQNKNQIKFLRLKCQTNTKLIQMILRETQYVNLALSATNTFPIDYAVKLVFPNSNPEGKPIVLQ